MPSVRPLTAISYALGRYGLSSVPDRVRAPDEPAEHPGRVADLTDLVCPPYDVINPRQQAALLARDPHNAVRLELSPEGDPHQSAARTLKEWLVNGTVERRPNPAFYYYRHARPQAQDSPSVQGVLAAVLLEPLGGGIRAHEHTMPGPKADRLALLRATRTQLSPILVLYFDRSERYRHVMGRAWTDEWRARDGDGLLHSLAEVEPDDRLSGFLSRQRLFIADGHHRYETALAYQAEVRADPRVALRPNGTLAADWVMAVLVNAETEEVEIRATHRILLDADQDALRALARAPDPLFQAIPVDPAELAQRVAGLARAAEPVFGLVLPDGEGWLLVGDANGITARMRREPFNPTVQALDLAVLHVVILGDRLGLEGEGGGAGGIAYTKDPHDAIARVASGKAAAAFLVRPTRIDQLAAVATAGDVMPEKSTYFYPKLLTGMAFHPLED
jgi:uncharacterized protein (DUF1015 family)